MDGFVKALVPNIECILSDIDGTLIGSDHGAIKSGTVKAISLAMEAGYKFYPCTGRSRLSMSNAVGSEFLNLWEGDVSKIGGVYQQGLMVYDGQGQLIFEKTLDTEIIKEAVAFTDLHRVAIIAYAGDRIICRSRCKQTDKIVLYKEPIPDVFPLGLENLQSSGIAVHKLILLEEDEVLGRIRPLLELALNGKATITKAVPGMLEILPVDFNKGRGVSILLEHLGQDAKNVIAFGDGENDVEMLKLVGAGVAVSNAKEVLKQVAKFVTTKSNDEEGPGEIILSLARQRQARRSKE